MNDSYKLCYIEDYCAWFTTQDILAQWGDDWNDAPYEHNAEMPYEWEPRRGVPEYHLFHVYFESRLCTPDQRNISISVSAINLGVEPWLQTDEFALRQNPPQPMVRIYGGTSYPDFVRLIEGAGGVVYVPKVPKEPQP